ncbi:MAG: hypothetical protein LBO80_02800 [Treponema sp.]|nr:hypothetical protein [Treponema sp.]
MKEKKKVLTGYRSRYRQAARKEKSDILNEVQFITGYNRKYVLRILNQPQAPQALLALKGKNLTKPGKFLKYLIPIRAFYTPEERKLPGFIQIDTGRL